MRGRITTIKSSILMVLRKMGYEVIPVARPSAGLAYERLAPLASYAPWNGDAGFSRAFEQVRANTFLDVYRAYELWSLAGQTAKLDGGAVLEVGSWRGGSGALLALGARRAGVNDPVYLCDTFRGVPKAGAEDGFYRGGEHDDTSAETVRSLLDRVGARDVTVLEGIFPDETASAIAAETRFRLCHIDVDVYRSGRDVLEWVWPRLAVGGVVVFDDYGFVGLEGITRYVDELRLREDLLYFYNQPFQHGMSTDYHETIRWPLA